MEQIGFFPINNPSNIYGLTNIMAADSTKCLVATLEKQIFAIESDPITKQITCNEIHFAYIPNSADIISIDSFVRSSNPNDIVLGITFYKNYKESESNEFRKNIVLSNNQNQNMINDKSNNKIDYGPNSSNNNKSTLSSIMMMDKHNVHNHYYLNIYSSLCSTNQFDLNQIAQDCQTFELDFVPYHLYHTRIINENNSAETIWLLSGSDHCVHIFREDCRKQSFYKDLKIDLIFPELKIFDSIVLWLDVYDYYDDANDNNQHYRLTAVGCENGAVHLFFIEFTDDTNMPRIIKSWKSHFDGPVLSVKFFKDKNENQSRMFGSTNENQNENESMINLMILNSCEQPKIYRNVQEQGLAAKKILPKNFPMVDLHLSCVIADVDFDLNNEIILAGYGKKIIFYKYDNQNGSYSMVNIIKVPYPVIRMTYLDITGDGIRELIAITTKGIIIYRHKIEDIIRVLMKKMEIIEKSGSF